MRHEVIVIGAGMVGTSVAWHLQKNNTEVLLIDKKLPGSETSYGNAGYGYYRTKERIFAIVYQRFFVIIRRYYNTGNTLRPLQ